MEELSHKQVRILFWPNIIIWNLCILYLCLFNSLLAGNRNLHGSEIFLAFENQIDRFWSSDCLYQKEPTVNIDNFQILQWVIRECSTISPNIGYGLFLKSQSEEFSLKHWEGDSILNNCSEYCFKLNANESKELHTQIKSH